MKIVKEINPKILAKKLEMDCEMSLEILQSEMEQLMKRLMKVETLRVMSVSLKNYVYFCGCL